MEPEQSGNRLCSRILTRTFIPVVLLCSVAMEAGMYLKGSHVFTVSRLMMLNYFMIYDAICGDIRH